MTASPEIRIFQDPEELAREAADFFVWIAGQTNAGASRFRVALSGGSTPQAMFTKLVDPSLAAQVKWETVELYFGDERCVPPDHPESNYHMANGALLQPLRIDSKNVFRMAGEAPEPDQAARDYEALLRRRFAVQPPAWPRFDLILLGLGEDGHTASLFPDTPALDEGDRLVVANQAPRGIPGRLTFTVPLINAARVVLFLVCGANKAAAARAVLEGVRAPRQYPAQLIQPNQGRLLWFLDRAAASELVLAKQQVVSHEE